MENNLSQDELQAIPHFYLESGLNYEKMSFGDRLLMKDFAKILSKKESKSNPGLSKVAQAIGTSYDSSSIENIAPLVSYVKNIQI